MKSEPILKPMSVARRDFISALTDLINTSMLPPFVIEDVLKDTCIKINELSQQQLAIDEKRYKESVAKATKDGAK